MRLDAEMTLHDADMHTFFQWWRRSMRAGYAYADGAHRHGRGPERHWVRQARSGLVLGGLLPLVALTALPATRGLSALTLGTYAVVYQRAKQSLIRRGFSTEDSALYARACVIGKFSELLGSLSFWRDHFMRRQTTIIEYK